MARAKMARGHTNLGYLPQKILSRIASQTRTLCLLPLSEYMGCSMVRPFRLCNCFISVSLLVTMPSAVTIKILARHKIHRNHIECAMTRSAFWQFKIEHRVAVWTVAATKLDQLRLGLSSDTITSLPRKGCKSLG